MAFQTVAYVGRGTKFYVQNPAGGAYVEVTQVESLGLPRAVKDEIEVTNLSSEGKEFQLDLPDFGETPVLIIQDEAKAYIPILDALSASSEVTGWRAILSDAGATQYDWQGRVKEYGPDPLTQGAIQKLSLVIRNTGFVTKS